MIDGKHSVVLYILAILVVCMPAGAQEIYRWVDEDGRVHYSDDPTDHPDAKPVELKPLNSPSDAPQPEPEQTQNNGGNRAAPTPNNTETEGEADRPQRASPGEQGQWNYNITNPSITGVWGLNKTCIQLVTKYVPARNTFFEFVRQQDPDATISRESASMVRIGDNQFEMGEERNVVSFRLSRDGEILETRTGNNEWTRHFRCRTPYQDKELIEQIMVAQ